MKGYKMEYYKIIAAGINGYAAVAHIENIFLQRGYAIESKSERALELKQTVFPINNNDPINAISRIQIECKGEEVTVRAELKGFDKLFKIISFMLIAMAVFFVALFGFIIPMPGKSVMFRILLPILPLALWPVVIPMMIKFCKARGARYLDTIINNAVTIAKAG